MNAPEKIFQKAVSALNQGDFADAERLFKKVLRGEPNNVAALNLLTVVLMSTGRFAEAEPVVAKAILLSPGSDAAYYNSGLILKRLNKPRQALQQFSKALSLNPAVSETWNNRGTVFNDLRQYTEATADFDRAISLKPSYSEAYANKGKSLAGLKRHDDAVSAYDKALALKPNLSEAWLGRGHALAELKRFEEAFTAYDKALALKPDLAEAWLGRGSVLAELKRCDEALAAYDKALALKPDLAEAWLGHGTVLAELKRYDEAFAAYNKALALKPDLAEAWLGRGNVFIGFRRFDGAFAAYEKALALKPDLAEAWLGRGTVLDKLERFDEAFAAYTQALNLKPDLKYAEGARLSAKINLCDWATIEVETLHFLSTVTGQKPVAVPSSLLVLPTSSADQLQVTKTFVADQVPFPALWRGEIYSHDRIRIGYLSADLRQHPVAQLAVGLFEQHDRSRFEVSAISFGPDDGSDLRSRIEFAAENFVDVSRMPDRAIAELIRDSEIDVIVDLMGLTADCRLSVVSERAAPIQVNFLGYPGTMGGDFMDYIIADRTVIPKEHFPFYSEQVVWLPDTYLPNAYRFNEDKHDIPHDERHVSQRVPTQGESILPEAAFVFCCFNGSYKITPVIFDVWMRLLTAVPDSVLWLSKPNPTAEANLGKEAERRGISQRRIIFAPRLPEMSDHLARLRQADLFLDTLPYNAHTTASDALWAGVPVLTCTGEAFAGRVATSLLRAVGLDELVTTSLEDYEALALKLARESSFLQAIKAKLVHNRDSYPLFDTTRFARHIEAAYVTMRERYQRGEKPHAFAVPPIT
jgi:protein O-GlcNAc transferase